MVTRICANPNCGKTFETATTTLTCSFECHEECRREYQRRRYREAVTGQVPILTKTQARWAGGSCCEEAPPTFCDECGSRITGRRNGAVYCSKKCAGKAYGRRRKEKRNKGKPKALEAAQVPKKVKLTGKALMQAQGVLITGKTDLQIAEEARAAGMSAGKYRALLQMQYEKEKGIGLYAN